MDTSLAVALAAGVTAIVSAALTYRASTKATRVNEQASVLSWAKDLREEATAARREANEARAQLRVVNQELTAVEGRCDELVDYLGRVLRWIHDPAIEPERLREMVPRELPAWPERNGRAR